MGGRRPYLLEGERDWLLTRLAEKPDLTLHALLAELCERGVVVSCDTLWRYLRRQGISFKKNRVRNRAGAPRHRAPPRLVEAAPVENRSCPSRLHRRDLGQDQYDPHSWLVATGCPAQGSGPARPLADDDLPRRTPARPHRRALRHRRANQR